MCLSPSGLTTQVGLENLLVQVDAEIHSSLLNVRHLLVRNRERWRRLRQEHLGLVDLHHLLVATISVLFVGTKMSIGSF